MKKLSIVLLAVFFIGIANVNAQSLFPSKTVANEEVKKCAKTGKVCNETCKNKAAGTCCQGKKSSCSKKVKKCGADCTKPCCAPPTIEEATPAATEEAAPENE